MHSHPKITQFRYDGIVSSVTFLETNQVKDGVHCDVYRFNNDSFRDLAIIRVDPDHSTPRQQVLSGNQTIEGFMSGSGTLRVERNGRVETYDYNGLPEEPVSVGVGDIMQWTAASDSELMFYEVCMPPYAEGRFKNL